MMKILIFGGSGFLGSHLAEHLLHKNYKVGIYANDSLEDSLNLKNIKDDIQYIKSSFACDINFDSIVQSYDCVYHLISSTTPSQNSPILDITENIMPTLRLLDACVRQKIKRIVFFSSGGTVYGIPTHIPIPENSDTNPISSYGIQKLMIEKYLYYYKYTYGLNISILRIANPYGKRQRPFSSQGLIANILGHYLTNQDIEIWGDGKVVRDYIYIDDVINAAERVLNYHGNETIFNISSGNGSSINDIISIIESIIGKNLRVQYKSGRKQDVPINVLDISKAINELKWQPKVSLKLGINMMLQTWNPQYNLFI